MLQLESGWQISIDYSSEWIFVRLESIGSEGVTPSFSESLWTIAAEQGVKRLVCEVAEAVYLNSYLIGQLVVLHKRFHLDGGTLRLCGLNDDNYNVLRMMQLSERFPNYDSREGAVMGYPPRKPR